MEAKLKKEADKIIKSVQARINKKGGYENAGQVEVNRYMSKVRSATNDYQLQCRLSVYINNGIDNLNYGGK